MALEIGRRSFVPQASRFHWAAVAGAIVECLAFAAAGGFSLWWWSPESGRIDTSASLLVDLSAIALFALAAGFGLGAFLLSCQRVEVRRVGAASHLVASALAACAAIWLGESELPASPNSIGYWPPWIALALAAALIAMGLAVLASLFVPVRHEIAR
jgi:hypothetical protein